MKYTMKDKKNNKVHRLKSMDELALEDGKDLFIVKLDGSKLHTYEQFVATAKVAFQTPTDESMIWLNEPGNIWSCWIEDLEWLLDEFEGFALIVEHWSRTLDREKKDRKERFLERLQGTCDYWGYEILDVRGGFVKPREFNIYLVG